MSEEILHWFTRARRFPRLIGKAPGGGSYPLGPYTMTQVIGAAAVFGIGNRTQGLWGQWGFWINNGLLVSATIVTLFALRLFKPGGRDPLSTAVAIMRVAFGPRHGRLQGKRISLGRAHRARHQVNAQLAPAVRRTMPEPTEATPAPSPREQAAQATNEVPAGGGDTVVAQLLAHVRTPG